MATVIQLSFAGSPFQEVLCPDLPVRDQCGWKTGANYKPFITGRRTRFGTASTLYGLKAGRIHEYLSRLESQLHYILEMRPDVVDFREQYPLYDEQELLPLLESGQAISRQKIMTLDVLLTRRNLASGKLVHYGLAVKYSKDLHNPAVWRRFHRERAACAERGWSWSLVTEREISEVRSRYARRICGYALRTNSNVHFEEARDLTDILMRRNKEGATLDSILNRAAKLLNCSRDHTYKLFGIASILGYLNPDANRPIGPSTALVLL